MWEAEVARFKHELHRWRRLVYCLRCDVCYVEGETETITELLRS